jgi:ADP-ribose pyrophosphatase YjhB (NUDIX family)
VDVVVLTVQSGVHDLSVLLVRRPAGDLALPGTFVHGGRTGALAERETLSDAVKRCLADKAGLSGVCPEQLFVFDNPNRDERGWVVSVAHLAVVPIAQLEEQRDPERTELVPLRELPALPWEHRDIVDKAVTHVRARYRAKADPYYLLGERFTMRELLAIHSAVAGENWTTRSADMRFRRSMARKVIGTEESAAGVPGKPAELFERA